MDLQSARVRPVGSGGIAHRTPAGFVMLGTADSREVLAVVEKHHSQSNLIELVVAQVGADSPEAFSMLFSAQGELFLLASGSAQVVISSLTTATSIAPQPSQILIQRIDLALNDETGRIVLTQKDLAVDEVVGLDSLVDLQSGTVLADALDISVRSHASGAEAVASTSAPAAAPIAAAPIAAASVPPAEAPSAAAPTGPIPAAAYDAPTEAPPELPGDSAEGISDAASGEPVGSSMPAPPPPAANEILFADDLDEIADLIGDDEAAEPSDNDMLWAEPAESVQSIPAPESAPIVAPVQVSAPELEAANDEPALPSLPPELSPPDPSDASGAFSGQVLDSIPSAVPEGAVTPPEPVSTVGPVMVLGVACPSGHHNHPDAVYCSQCGTKMGVHHTTVLLNGPRPPLGVLVVDDGKTWSIASDLIIGREPGSHADVAAGTAASMSLTDDTLSLSRQHARISLDDWSVYVIDMHSSNGTFLNRNRSSQEWSPVPSDLALPLEPGDRIRVGGRIIQVELHHVK